MKFAILVNKNGVLSEFDRVAYKNESEAWNRLDFDWENKSYVIVPFNGTIHNSAKQDSNCKVFEQGSEGRRYLFSVRTLNDGVKAISTLSKLSIDPNVSYIIAD